MLAIWYATFGKARCTVLELHFHGSGAREAFVSAFESQFAEHSLQNIQFPPSVGSRSDCSMARGKLWQSDDDGSSRVPPILDLPLLAIMGLFSMLPGTIDFLDWPDSCR